MKFLASALLILLSSADIAHEGHQAFFTLKVENSTLLLVSKLELPDTKQAVSKSGLCSEEQDFNWCASAWLVDCISISVNGKMYSLRLESSFTEDGHLYLNHTLGSAPDNIEQIEVRNTSFLKAFAHYHNMFEILIGDSKEGYKMDESRTEITYTNNQ